MKYLLPFIIAIQALGQTQNSPLWGDLQLGNYQVGFREYAVMDSTRSFNGGHRPVQIGLWYPALESTSLMEVREYYELESREIDFDSPYKLYSGDKTFLGRMGRHGASADDLNKLLNTGVMARKNAEPAEGKFPLIIFVQGGGRPASSAFILSEYLASRGFYVATMPHIGLHTQKNDGGQLQNDLQIEDIEFIKGYFSNHPGINITKLGLIAFSTGVEASFLYQMKNRNADVLVTLDGVPDTTLLKKSPYYFPEEVDIPLLIIQSNHGKKFSVKEANEPHEFGSYFQESDRTVLRFMELNHPGLLSIGMIESTMVPKVTRFPPIGNTQLSHELLCRAVANFLLTYLKAEETGFGEDTDEDLVVRQHFPAQ